MAKCKCKNFGSCSLADSGKEFDVPLGGDDKCPECGMTLAPLTHGSSAEAKGSPRKILLLGGSTLVALALGVGGYSWWSSKQVVVLEPENTPHTPKTASSSTTAASGIEAASPPGFSASQAEASPRNSASNQADLMVGETASRITCDEATRNKRPDAEKICRRAAAVTLLNSGAQAAVAGKLDQAERDYAAAQEKDPDLPEIHFNIAALKARQGKDNEALDHLAQALEKGFSQSELITSEPAFAKLKGDPAKKARLDQLLNRR